MSFVSYAQNFEDVMLWRALKHVKHGFYIDIGAQDPVIDSVSMAFYEHGWRGVHVEPTQQYSQKLRIARPDETVLQVAIGSAADSLTFFEFENTGLSTGDAEIAQTHVESGFTPIQTVVPVMSLDTLFEQVGNREIHWLKLDVEGLEKSVLESWAASESRPWILVVESTKPLTQEQNHEEWEALILQKQYRFVYFDGLNRFYVSTAHADLALAFSSPPNVFDGFVLSGQASQPYYRIVEAKAQQAEARAATVEAESRATVAEARAATVEAESRAAVAEARASNAEAALEAVRKELHDVHQANHHHWHLAEARHQQIQALLGSTSWRITAPLRWVVSAMRGLTPNALKPRAKVFLQHAALYVGRRPRLKNTALKILHRSPRLKSRLFRVITGLRAQPVQPQNVPTEIAHLTPRARQIHADLKAAIERRKKEIG